MNKKNVLVLIAIGLLIIPIANVAAVETYHMFFPSINCPPARKGVGGSMTTSDMAVIGTMWYHHWSLCTETEPDTCVDVSKGFWTWQDPPDGYGQGPDEIDAALLQCRSGWFMFGDEWEYQNWLQPGYYPISKQIEEARWYIQRRASVNPDCKLAFGGILTFHPMCRGGSCEYRKIAVDWLSDFYNAYVVEYGEAPDVDAIVFDDYYWASHYYGLGYPWQYWDDVTREAVQTARDLYGSDIEIWAREIGSLRKDPGDHDRYPLEALEQLDEIVVFYDRYAWFISKANSGSPWYYCAIWVDGELTPVGEAYAEFERGDW